MDSSGSFFDRLNNYFGISSPSDFMVNPYVIGFMIVLGLYAVFAGQRIMAILIAGILGIGIICHYLYPGDTSNLTDLLTFVVVAGAYLLILVYFGFIRE
jgi:hypothetical protein